MVPLRRRSAPEVRRQQVDNNLGDVVEKAQISFKSTSTSE